ncbi:nodal homolog 3-A-like [Hyla sarda]|uniref:nodal homolog 3-A-like n=1 Tax=Hyla sarda TaxID=327740 RepID=UPI0024C3865A|nr:nodal homolog 3-A-like [Hyla sarda]
MAMKIILYIIFTSLVSGRPLLPPRALPRAINHAQGVRIPDYMLNLYHTLMGNNKDRKRPEIQVLEESDTIQSLTAKDFTVEDDRWSLTFDFSSVSRTDELRMVELRVHLPPFTKSSNITVDIYHINNGQHKLFLGSVMTNIPDVGNNSLTTVNVTKIIEKSLWGKRPANNGEDDKTSEDISDKNLFENSRKIKKRDVSLPEITTDQAIIVFFTKHKPFSKPETPSLLKKLSVDTMKMVAFRRHKRTKRENQLGNPSSLIVGAEFKPSCKKVDMVVDFKEIGWDKWVIYPKKYNAYRCEGTCHSPLKEASKTTNHDYIKNLIKLKDSERMECSSCVPLKMRPLSMMFHENRHLVVRHHDDMIIEECGFQ